MKRAYLYMILCFLLGSCTVLKQKSKAPLETGQYQMKTTGATKSAKVYVTVDQDSVTVYPLIKTQHAYIADTVHAAVFTFPQKIVASTQHKTFAQNSVDVDVLTIVFKYRPGVNGFPKQFNTNFNGALYVGYRSDNYVISYDKTPLGYYEKNTSHYAYGFGLFFGAGATAMNQWVTNNTITIEYDGLVLTKGVAFIIGVGNLTFGLAAGFDHLLDGNHANWIYQGKPWFGLNLGLNLN